MASLSENLGVLLKIGDCGRERSVRGNVLLTNAGIAAEDCFAVHDEGVLDLDETRVMDHVPSRPQRVNVALRPEDQLVDDLTIFKLFAVYFTLFDLVDAFALVEHSQNVANSICHLQFPLSL